MRKIIIALFGALLVPLVLCAQTIVKVPSDLPPQEGNLNAAVQKAIDAGTLSTTEFQLEPYGYYVLIGTINVPAGKTLTITAPAPGTTQQTAPPQIVWTATGGVASTNPPPAAFDCFGDLVLKNIWIRYATTTGTQVGTSIVFEENAAAPNGRNGTFENVMFDYCPCPMLSAGAVTLNCSKFRGMFKNCYWKNCVDAHLRYYGRAVSFPFDTQGFTADSLQFENCTFANMGYVLMQEKGEYTNYVKFNHCTFLNVIMFPFESGWWNKMSVTNCLFQNCFMFGYLPSQQGTGDPNGATLRIDSTTTFGFTVPYTEQDRRILFTHSSNFTERWLLDWMRYNPYSIDKFKNRLNDDIPVPMPMVSPGTRRFFDSTLANGQKAFPYMNVFKLDSASNPGFLVAPTDSAKLKVYMWKKWNDNSDTNWAYQPDDGFMGKWPLRENLAYTNTALKTFAMGGFPVGDLYHWWPTQYTAWAAQAKTENATLLTELATGKVTAVHELSGSVVPSAFVLEQNYPNPFNPSTQIGYSVPKTSYLSLKVYNLLGQEVATLFDGVQNAGSYTAEFNATGLSSGVYMYRLHSDNVSLTKKFVLMK
jgi:hypothetical protein